MQASRLIHMVNKTHRAPSPATSTGSIKAHILVAAKAEFAQYGFEGARMQRVADRAGLPKPNIHYHFKSKQQLYLAVLERIIESWNLAFDQVSETSDPAEALEAFIRQKLKQAQQDPTASRLFANEMIQGAPNLKHYLNTSMRSWVQDRALVIKQWIRAGKIRDVDPERLIFLIWSATQHYADFQVQALCLLNRAEFDDNVLTETADFLVTFILQGCGLATRDRPS